MSEIELAWAAGFYDGEGCTSWTHVRGGHRYLNVQITQAEPTVLHRFHDAVGCGKIYGPYRRLDKSAMVRTHWRFQAHSREAERVIFMLLPYLSAAKAEQFRRALKHVAEFGIAEGQLKLPAGR